MVSLSGRPAIRRNARSPGARPVRSASVEMPIGLRATNERYNAEIVRPGAGGCASEVEGAVRRMHDESKAIVPDRTRRHVWS
jgi:hypothetical protein